MAISARPPGEVASISVTGCSPLAQASTTAKAAHSTIMPSVPSATAASQRGAACKKRREKRTPRLTPITSCAAWLSAGGTADRCTSSRVRPMATSSGPMNQGLAPPVRRISAAPAPLASASHSRPGHSTTRATAGSVSSACSCQCWRAHCMANGSVSTTAAMRTLCAAATRSVRAPARSASSVISDAPPMVLA